MEYYGMRIGVFYKDRDWVDKWFSDFLQYYTDKSCIIKVVKNSYNPHAVYLKDGTCIIAYDVNHMPRGKKFDKVYIEPIVCEDVINMAIRPMMLNSCIVEYEL